MKRLYLIIIEIFSIIIIVESAAIIFVCALFSNISFKLNGEQTIILNLNENYADAGFAASTMNWDLSEFVTTEQTIDTSHTGSQYIEYNLDFLGRHYTLKRYIEVIDNVNPVVTLNGENELKLYVGDEYVDAGAVAEDNYDGNITGHIQAENNLDTSQAGEYHIIYTVADSSGNKSSISRKIIVEEKPKPDPTPNPISTPVASISTDTSADVYTPYTSTDPIAEYIANHGYDVSVGYYNLSTGRQYFYQADRLYYGASLIKTLDAIYLYDKNMVDDNTKYYIDRAISVSDNNAHIYLVNYIGRNILKQYGIGLGAFNTLSYDSNYGDTTVMDQLAYFKKAYEISQYNANFKTPFINNFYNYIQIDGIPTMHKHGYYDEWYHDAGIVFDEEPYIIIILTKHGKGNKYEVIHNLSNLVYQYHKGNL